MTVASGDAEERGQGPDLLWRRVLLSWRARCAIRHADIELTSGVEAIVLCSALVAALGRGSQTPDLTLAARTWGAHSSSPDQALSALQCLRDAAVALTGELPAGLAPEVIGGVLDHMMLEALGVMGAPAVADTDVLTGCGGRAALDEELELVVSGAAAAGLDAAVAVVEVNGVGNARKGRGAERDTALLGLVAALRQATGSAERIYRVGDHSLAVVAPYTDDAGMGELMLQATCLAAPRFSWGTASLTSAGLAAGEDPDVLVMLAHANLHLRRRDHAHATAALIRHRRRSAVASVAAAMVLLAGIVLGLGGARGNLNGTRAAGRGAVHTSLGTHVIPPASASTTPAPVPTVRTAVPPPVAFPASASATTTADLTVSEVPAPAKASTPPPPPAQPSPPPPPPRHVHLPKTSLPPHGHLPKPALPLGEAEASTAAKPGLR